VDGQYDKLVMAVGHQFITLTVDICVRHGRHEAPRRFIIIIVGIVNPNESDIAQPQHISGVS